jgi:hypothetical protein
MTLTVRTLRILRNASAVVAACALASGARVVSAQTPPATQPAPAVDAREFESRAQLEAQAIDAEAHHRTSEAWLLRNRLEKGDFQEGDRIVIMLESTVAKSRIDTVVVRAGKVVQFPQMDDLKLEGVLRSELTDAVEKHMARYLRDPRARTTPLIRIAVMGSVGRQGYYDTAADIPLTDLIMKAGGPGGDTDLGKIIIRRGSDIIWSGDDTKTAVHDGLSLDRLHLRAGDEVYITPRRNISWFNALSISLSMVGLIVTLIRLR